MQLCRRMCDKCGPNVDDTNLMPDLGPLERYRFELDWLGSCPYRQHNKKGFASFVGKFLVGPAQEYFFYFQITTNKNSDFLDFNFLKCISDQRVPSCSSVHFIGG